MKQGYRKPSLAPTERATNKEILWAAGFFEGDGTTSYNGGSAVASITQKDRWALEKMRHFFGGNICTQGSNSLQWYLNGARSRGFLQTIYGLVSPRRQAQIAKVLDW